MENTRDFAESLRLLGAPLLCFSGFSWKRIWNSKFVIFIIGFDIKRLASESLKQTHTIIQSWNCGTGARDPWFPSQTGGVYACVVSGTLSGLSLARGRWVVSRALDSSSPWVFFLGRYVSAAWDSRAWPSLGPQGQFSSVGVRMEGWGRWGACAWWSPMP